MGEPSLDEPHPEQHRLAGSAEDREHREQNRRSWNVATAAHNRHKGQQAQFLAAGGSTLFAEERQLLGDLCGLRLLHLLCNSGQDSLSLVHLGAEVTGVDISDEAIETARQLSQESALEATFLRSDVYEFLEQSQHGEDRWDVVFLSYGALPWLSDIHSFFAQAARLLRPGGRLVVMEFHPMLATLNDGGQLEYSYFHRGAERWAEGVGDYVAESGTGLAPQALRGEGESEPAPQAADPFVNPHHSFEFQWSVGEVVSAVLAAPLRLTSLEEYPFINGWKGHPELETSSPQDDSGETRVFRWPGAPKLPLMFSLTARRSTR
ncbi:MAG: class I SAM-dependent methyltransferase [Acidobacteriota bacterium]